MLTVMDAIRFRRFLTVFREENEKPGFRKAGWQVFSEQQACPSIAGLSNMSIGGSVDTFRLRAAVRRALSSSGSRSQVRDSVQPQGRTIL